MKKKRVLILAALVAGSMIVGPVANAIDFSVRVGDRAYYEGPEYWDWGWHWVWVPGHWRHHRWIHGYYERRGDWRGEYLHERHNWRHHDRDRH